jgi:hypothetical protein
MHYVYGLGAVLELFSHQWFCAAPSPLEEFSGFGVFLCSGLGVAGTNFSS